MYKWFFAFLPNFFLFYKWIIFVFVLIKFDWKNFFNFLKKMWCIRVKNEFQLDLQCWPHINTITFNIFEFFNSIFNFSQCVFIIKFLFKFVFMYLELENHRALLWMNISSNLFNDFIVTSRFVCSIPLIWYVCSSMKTMKNDDYLVK